MVVAQVMDMKVQLGYVLFMMLQAVHVTNTVVSLIAVETVVKIVAILLNVMQRIVVVILWIG